MRKITIAVLAAVLGTTACRIGGNAAEWPVAVSPNGATIVAVTTSGKLTGELLEVRDDGLVLLRESDRRIVLVPNAAVRQVQVPKLSKDFNVRLNGFQNIATRKKLAAVSHFPQGMTDDIRKRMLASTGQTEMEVLP